MDSPSPLPAYAAMLSPGMVVGDWRIEGWAGRGVYGAVYRAVSLKDPQATLVALKLALLPEDPRFAREVEVLSRFDHPSIPRLLDHGSWLSPAGTRHPFLVMQWVDGMPLYDYARVHPPSPAQVRHWLASLAQALAALHAQGVVHRDLKGDNVLVRRSDGHAMLMDFGSGIYPGAATLTPHMYFPGTPAYRSPESWLFELRFYRDATARYTPGPADDLYALGVTACSLLTGEYPELADPIKDEHGTWQLEAVIPPPTLLSSARIEPSLRALILRLLSVHPEQRGTAAQVAEELEQGTSRRPRASRWRGGPWLAMVAAGVALAVCVWPDASSESLSGLSLSCVTASEVGSPHAGTRGLGEMAAAVSMEQTPSPAHPEMIAEDTPPKPLPRQVRPDAKGLCPRKWQISLNGGCWELLSQEREACDLLNGQMFKSLCYVPIIPPGRSPTSSPATTP